MHQVARSAKQFQNSSGIQFSLERNYGSEIVVFLGPDLKPKILNSIAKKESDEFTSTVVGAFDTEVGQ